ncbi:hypothetical protein HNR62_002226 [Oceanisphaera litoralis]|uniref:DUF6482 family protein n=1 Tax=Oceanisphaera litoralis TaxID=225144 RepID=UPI00195992CF|nr:DUF6482 family protein [Oceanisphaera litoralis]MBM7456340.1 hypothetical protein [Oceanisphaera litoralis]
MITLTHLLSEQPKVERLSIQSHDMCMYLVELIQAGNTDLLAGDDGRPLVFRSIEHIKQQLAGLQVASAVLVQHSPYHEMIGLADDPVPPMEIAIVWPC